MHYVFPQAIHHYVFPLHLSCHAAYDSIPLVRRGLQEASRCRHHSVPTERPKAVVTAHLLG